MAGTRLIAVRSALIAGVAQLPAFSGAKVDFQWVANVSERERVWTRRARFNHTTASLRAGRNFRNEVGRFEVVVLVEGVDKTAEWTSERAADLGLEIEEFVADRKNNELGVAGMQTLTVDGDGQLVEMFGDLGHLAELSYPIRYTARLT